MAPKASTPGAHSRWMHIRRVFPALLLLTYLLTATVAHQAAAQMAQAPAAGNHATASPQIQPQSGKHATGLPAEDATISYVLFSLPPIGIVIFYLFVGGRSFDFRVRRGKLAGSATDTGAKIRVEPKATLPDAEVSRPPGAAAVMRPSYKPLVPASDPDSLLPPGGVILESVTIRNFRSIAEMTVNVGESSDLGGNWTCIAGLNGAGKSSVLQAICLLLLGERLTAELGVERLRRMWRRTGGFDHPPELSGSCRIGDERFDLYLPLAEEGVDRARLAEFGSDASSYQRMDAIWRRLLAQPMASYGATRNLSNYPDRRYASLSQQVQRQMTLFDPLTQIANVDVLLQGGREARPILQTLHALLRKVLSEPELGHVVVDGGNRLNFSKNGAALEALDLPDGFRSVVAWLADLCAAWHQTQPGSSTDPARITGIAIVDEIDLHLHASLQRSLVPALRKALPNVQFVVTTHSPLILSCFDRRELVILDRNSQTGIRELDRDLFGMSMDDIYRWLMGTRPESPVIADMLHGADPKAAVLLEQSPHISEAEALEQIAARRAFLERMKARRAS